MKNVNEMDRSERIEARKMIDARTEAVIEAYKKSERPGEAVEMLVQAYGYNKAVLMVATVINRVSLYDGRIYDSVREWAQGTGAPTNAECEALGRYGVDSYIHSAHVNEIGRAMKDYTPTAEDLESEPKEDEEPPKEAEQVTAEQVSEYEAKHGAEAAADLLALCPPDRFSGDYNETAARLQERAKRAAERKADEAKTYGENFGHCKSIAEDLEKVAEGVMYRCPHCGELYSIEDADEAEGGHICPSCGEEIEESEAEEVGFYDWFSDVFDVEYRISSDGTYRSCRLMVACGGPNIYIDTASATVELYWWGDRATAYFSRDTAEQIDIDFEELYSCTR